MRRIVIVMVMVVLLAPVAARAQRESLSETYEGDGIRFSYPEGWILEDGRARAATFKNMEFDPFDLEAGIPTGAIQVRIFGDLVAEDADIDVLHLSVDEPEYALGYFMGGVVIGEALSWGDAQGGVIESEVGELTRTTIGDFETIYAVSTARNDILIMILIEDDKFAAGIVAMTSAGEMGRWQKLVFAIAGTVEVFDEVVTQPSEPLLTDESLTNAFEELLMGNPEPAKALSCEADHASIEQAAESIASVTDEEGVDMTVFCAVDGDEASCEMTIVVEIEGQEPIEQSQTITSQIVDGKLCGEFE